VLQGNAGTVASRSCLMTPVEYAERFAAQRPLTLAEQTGNIPCGVVGRFMRGVKPLDFASLSDEPGKKLSWVM
jgi:hypothetical protein